MSPRSSCGRRLIAGVAAACIIAAPPRGTAQSAASSSALASAHMRGVLDGLDDFVEASMRAWGTPGVAVAVVRGDSLIYAKGFGVRELGRAGPVDPQTVFAIGSATKAMTAAALGILVDEGKLAWDDRVAARLPGFEFSDQLLTAQVTIRDLLTHRTGLPGNNLLFWGTPLGRDELVRRVRYLSPNKGLRTGFEYQNIMYLVAGQVIPATTGQSWDAFLSERLFRPLAMSATTANLAEARARTNVATPHQGIGQSLHAIPWLDLGNVGPAGGVHSTAVDMARWVAFELGDGAYRGQRILSERTLAETHTPQMAIRPEFPWTMLFPDKPVLAYGLGWFVSDYRGVRVIEHGGDTDGMSSMVALLPERRTGFVILTNAEGPFLRDAVKFWLLDAFIGQDQPARTRRDWNVEFLRAASSLQPGGGRAAGRSAAPSEPGMPSHRLDAYAGTFHDNLYGDAIVRVDRGSLAIRLLGAEGRGTPVRFDTFRFDFPNTTTQLGRMRPLGTFELDDRGQISALSLVGERFERIGR